MRILQTVDQMRADKWLKPERLEEHGRNQTEAGGRREKSTCSNEYGGFYEVRRRNNDD